MKGRILTLLLFHLHIFFIIPDSPSSANSSLYFSRVVHVSYLKTWMAARNYCRANYTDLVTYINAQEFYKLDMYEGWIGLYKGPDDIWKWITHSEHGKKEIGPKRVDWCLLKNLSQWEIEQCNHYHPFLCVDESLILVQEMKTWEEALQYCRELQAVGPTEANTTTMYELASLPETSNILLNTEILGLTATTNEVWVGLRFLAGEWLWMSGEAVTSSYLPQCSAQDEHCGALGHNNTHWKTMDCSEKRNFLCSIKL